MYSRAAFVLSMQVTPLQHAVSSAQNLNHQARPDMVVVSCACVCIVQGL